MRKYWNNPTGWFIVAGISLGYLFFPFIVDDVFIHFRYAENLAAGLGAVFNPGERVEGYSSPLWVLLLSALSRLPGDLYVPAKILSFLCYLLTGIVLIRMSTRLGHSPWVSAVVYLSSLSLVSWGVSGMETSLQALLYLLTFWSIIGPKPGQFRVFLLFTLLLATRPESPLIVAVFFTWLVINRHLNARIVSACAVTALLLLVCRYAYYTDWLPNTYYAKNFQTWSRWHITIMNYMKTYFQSSGLLYLVVSFFAWYCLDRKKAMIIYSFSGAQLFFCIYTGGDWMPEWRFFVPVIPVFAFMSSAVLSQFLTGPGRPVKWAALLLITTHILLNIISTAYPAPPQRRFSQDRNSLELAIYFWNPNYLKVTNWLKSKKPYPQSLATGEAGFFCYYTQTYCLDLHGLADRTIGKSREFPNTVIGKKLPIGEEGFIHSHLGKYILGKQPEYFILSPAETGGPRQFLLDSHYVKIKEFGNFQIFSANQPSQNP
ncbi:hypothetical protein ACFL5V_02695 [Fibrobacterota bacterium]